MATSKALGYLGSTKNLVGCLGGLAGVLLHVTGVVGPLWPVVVAALYGAGALLAPPEAIVLRADPAAETARLRSDLDALQAAVHRASNRMPTGGVEAVDRITEVLSGLLARPELHTDPDALHDVIRLVRTDVPLAVESYLKLPRWFAAATKAGGELTTQLTYLEVDATAVATRFHADDLRKIADHRRYLEDRNREP